MKHCTLAYIDALVKRAEGRLWFDEQGHLNQSGPVPLSRYLGELSDQLRLFLARLDSCERTDTGGYLLRDARAGNLGGMRVLWDNVVLLAHASITKTLPGMTPDQCEVVKRDGLLATVTAPTRNAQPLVDALRQLLFSILYNADGSWVSEIPSATVAKIRTIGAELTQHQAAWERSEGGSTRAPMLSASPDLLERLERAAAAVNTHAIDRALELATEKMARKLGAGDNGNTNPFALPSSAEAIDEHDAALLEFLNRNPSLRRKVCDVLPDSGPGDRKAIARRLRAMADRVPPLVAYPKGKQGKVAILPAGIEMLKRVTAQTPH